MPQPEQVDLRLTNLEFGGREIHSELQIEQRTSEHCFAELSIKQDRIRASNTRELVLHN